MPPYETIPEAVVDIRNYCLRNGLIFRGIALALSPESEKMISTTLPDGKPLAEEPGAQNDEVVGITLRGTRVMIPGKPDKIVPPTRIFRVMMNSVVLTERFLKTGRLVFGRDFLECIVKEEGKPPRWTWELLLEDGMVVLELRNERDGREKNPNSI